MANPIHQHFFAYTCADLSYSAAVNHNYVVVGQILSAVSNFKMSITVGIVIIAILSYIISIFGFRVVHTFEKYSWIYTLILFFVLIGQAAPTVNPSLPAETSGLGLAGAFLSILAINFCKMNASRFIPSEARLTSYSECLWVVLHRFRLLL